MCKALKKMLDIWYVLFKYFLILNFNPVFKLLNLK